MVVGVDIAASRPCVAVAVRGGRTLEVVAWTESDDRVGGDRARFFAWLEGLGAVAVGVDAPQRPRRSRGAAATRPRACDADLAHRRISIYQVPTRAVAAAADGRYAWMETGWEYFRELGRRGFEPPAPGTLARRARPGAGRARGVPARHVHDPARGYAAAQELARPACACASPRCARPA